MPDIRPILLVNGLLLSILAVSMLIPAFADYHHGNPDWQVFLSSAAVTLFIGISLYLSNRGYSANLTLRHAFLITASAWVLIPAFAALPLVFAEDLKLSYTDAFFEMTSGLTTTGASVISGLEKAPPGILLWRSLMMVLGGIGIIVLALAILPMLRIGGMQLFRRESSDNYDKLLPSATQLAFVVTGVYAVLASIFMLLLWLAGMSGFDAFSHSVAALSTGGFGNYDNSVAHFDSPLIEGLLTAFMVMGGLPMIFYYQMFRTGPGIWRNSQVFFYLGTLAVCTAILALWLVFHKDFSALSALRYASFNVVSLITTTGFTSTDFSAWGHFATTFLFFMIVIGGCTGSTTGGIKIFRLQVLFETVKAQLNQIIHPHGVFLARYNRKPLAEGVLTSVMNFSILFAASFGVLSIAVSLCDVDFLTSMSAVGMAMANTGVGLGSIIGPSGNFAPLPDGAKWLLSFAMILGRLELVTVLVLFSPHFWRD